mmetsp:Transcript_38282/g.62067  ORF Transcript_38282/g.62067 Transcript_38282/m.62067 type:complete len:278 (-) Transcript_38282:22-855(-)
MVHRGSILVYTMVVAGILAYALGSHGVIENHPVCEEIRTGPWWIARAEYNECIEQVQQEAARTTEAELAEACQAKTPTDPAPQGRRAKAKWRMYHAAECKAVQGCEWVGAGRHTCQYNVCHDRNDKTCTLEKTKGLCVWYKKSDRVFKDNKLQIGCYKNPCNAVPGGLNKRSDCMKGGDRKFTCTWCAFRHATTAAEGAKMGCQIAETRVGTRSARCATCIDNPSCYKTPSCFFRKVLSRRGRRCRRRGGKYCGCRLLKCPNANVAVERITQCDVRR